ncbi:MAG: nitrogen regulation protein NR(I) [Magnetovibrio sp.]|nr:nitrogen regulation protein NR(I) [Magnetovibrio sp.]
MKTAPTILLADDDSAIRTVVSQALTRAGFEVRATEAAAMLWKWVEEGNGDLVITDVVMPDESGLDLIPRIRRIRPDLRIVVMSAQSTLQTAVKATESGAFEYLPKPFDINELVAVVKRGVEKKDNVAVPRGIAEDIGDALPLIGRSGAMQEVYRTLARLMPTDLTVMVSGGSGTGKELVARALHDYGKRKQGPFVAVNMAAIPRTLIESELFGYEKGAFTGATARTSGRFEQANAGTLFLDEIGDMPMEAQTRLLRVLQEGEFTTVGGQTPIVANARIIAATHHDLKQLIRQGLFREDLFFRLNVVPILLPPLRSRVEDIPELVRHFLARGKNAGLPWKTLDSAALDRLMRHSWPGNVRELENLIQRLTALYSEENISLSIVERELGDSNQVINKDLVDISDPGLASSVERHLSSYFAAHQNELPATGLYSRVLREVEKPLIMLTLQATRGNQIRAAQVLGLNRNTLRKKIRELDIPVIRGGR